MAVFELGQIVTTCGVAKKMNDDILFRVGVQQALANHSNGDWGDLGDEDKEMNDEALKAEKEGKSTDEIFSAYNIGNEKIYIITEWDRSVTTILLPREY